uniref:Uncharacterized protein n=1 Tax=Arundo donax TaxID=35708 RepID=A0A0A9FN18_ARUDO
MFGWRMLMWLGLMSWWRR